MPQLSTGLVIAGAYADKVRRVLFAQLKDEIKSGKLTPQKVAQKAGELNRILFEILVNKLKIDKGDVVRIRVEYDLHDSEIEWHLETLSIEVFKRVPEEEVEKAVKETISKAKEILGAPVTAAEAEWTGEKPTEGEVLPTKASRVIRIGSEENKLLYLILDEKGSPMGIAELLKQDRESKITVIVKPEGVKHALKTEHTIGKSLEEISDEELLNMINSLRYQEAPRDEAEKLIREAIKLIS